MEPPAFDESAAAIAIRRYRTQLPRFRREFADAVQRFHAEAAARGIARSGAFVQSVQRLCQDESTRRIGAARDAVEYGLEGGWATTASEAIQTLRTCLDNAPDPGSFGDIDVAITTAIAISGILPNASQTDGIRSGIVTVRGEVSDEAEAELAAVARKVQLSGGSSVFNAPVGSVQIGERNKAIIGATEPEPYIIAEDPKHQLEREGSGGLRVPRKHLEVLLDPSLQGVIVRECKAAPIEPEDRDPAALATEDPMGRILLSNVGGVPAVRLHLTLPIMIKTQSPFRDEVAAYQKDEVIRHQVLVHILRPGSIMITVTNRLSSPIVIGIRPEANDERDVEDVDAEHGLTRVPRKLTIQTLVMFLIRASTRRRF
jgi:hypothetical protein